MLEDERALVDAKRGASRLGFALLLKFFTCHGRFPAGGAELPGEVVEFVARQVQVAPAEVRSYEWTGRSIERHRAEIREHLGFRECSVGDAEQLDGVAGGACRPAERRPELVRDELLARCRASGSSRRRRGGLIALCGRRFAPARRCCRRGSRHGWATRRRSGSQLSSLLMTPRTRSRRIATLRRAR